MYPEPTRQQARAREAIVDAAMALHHARLRRIAAAKAVPDHILHPYHRAATHALDAARKAESAAKAALFRACTAATTPDTIDVTMKEHRPEPIVIDMA